jgi:hypothetical protein
LTTKAAGRRRSLLQPVDCSVNYLSTENIHEGIKLQYESLCSCVSSRSLEDIEDVLSGKFSQVIEETLELQPGKWEETPPPPPKKKTTQPTPSSINHHPILNFLTSSLQIMWM